MKRGKKEKILAVYYATRTTIAPMPEIIMQRLQNMEVADRMKAWKYLEHAARRAWIKKSRKLELIEEDEVDILLRASKRLLKDSLRMCNNEH